MAQAQASANQLLTGPRWPIISALGIVAECRVIETLADNSHAHGRLKHRAEKWMPVFGKNDAKTKS